MIHALLVLSLAAAPHHASHAKSKAPPPAAAAPAETATDSKLVAVPDFDASHIVDQTSTFTADDRERLSEMARKLTVDAPDKDLEFAVLLVPTTRGEPIDAFTRRVATRWRIGSPDIPNTGILLVAAKDDHQMRVEVGAGLEKVLDDDVRRYALDNAMTPAFRKGAFGAGFASGIQLIRRAYVERTGMPAVPGHETASEPAPMAHIEAPQPSGHDAAYYIVWFMLLAIGGSVVAFFFFASRDRSGYSSEGGGSGASDSSWSSRDDVFTSSISSSLGSSSSSSSDSFSSGSSSDFSKSSGGSSDNNGSSGSW